MDDQFVIGYTGAIGMAHDLETALSGMAELSATDAAATLLLVGDGVKRAALMQVASRQGLTNVHFHPAIDKGTVPALLHRCDACLMQAGNADYFKYGLSPNKLFDYFAAGKPVLIASAHPTVVEEAGAGIRFQPGDPGAFADAVRRLRSLSPEERREMGRRGQELARTTYSIQAIADRYEQVLREVVAPGALTQGYGWVMPGSRMGGYHGGPSDRDHSGRRCPMPVTEGKTTGELALRERPRGSLRVATRMNRALSPSSAGPGSSWTSAPRWCCSSSACA